MNPQKLHGVPLKEQERVLQLEEILRLQRHESRAHNRTEPRLRATQEVAQALNLGGAEHRILVPLDRIHLRCYGRGKRIQELLNRGLAKYPAPEFLLKAMIRPEFWPLLGLEGELPGAAELALMRDLWLDFSQGVSPAPRLEGLVRKKDIHKLWEVGHQHNLEFARAYVYARGRGVGPKLAELLPSYLCRKGDLVRAVRWVELNPWLEKMEDPSRRLRFLQRQLQDEDWVPVPYRRQRRVPREPEDLMSMGRRWAPISTRPWKRQTGRFEWRAIELTSEDELIAEGKAQDNCVGTYAWSCLVLGCRVFSLRWMVPESLTPGGFEIERVTVEVSHEGQVIQAEAKGNTRPSWQGLRRVQDWATEVGFKCDLNELR